MGARRDGEGSPLGRVRSRYTAVIGYDHAMLSGLVAAIFKLVLIRSSKRPLVHFQGVHRIAGPCSVPQHAARGCGNRTVHCGSSSLAMLVIAPGATARVAAQHR